MATPVRFFQKNEHYHIYNRGNRKENIFITSRDYGRFLKSLKEYKDKFNITVLCYCLMPNHFHLLIRPNIDESVSMFMLRLGTSYAKYFNIKYDQVGSLFQGRFKAKVINSDEYLLELSRYIHRNPLEILSPTPGVELANYKWSSYSSYLGTAKNEIVDTSTIIAYFKKDNPAKDYKSFVEYEFDKGKAEELGDLVLEDF